jgi:hypothetical protein
MKAAILLLNGGFLQNILLNYTLTLRSQASSATRTK